MEAPVLPTTNEQQNLSYDNRIFSTLDAMESFIDSTKDALFIRRADSLLMIRPDKTMGLNATALEILDSLYSRDRKPLSQSFDDLAHRMGVERDRLIQDAQRLLETLGSILNDDLSPRQNIKFTSFERSRVAFPTLSEIALTYGCQNRCQFCYASSPDRKDEHKPMTTDQVKLVMDKIFHQAHVPSLSFTGGESTLRPDLPELIRYGVDLGLRVNLITNGIRISDIKYAKLLADSHLASAQVSLEAAQSEIHDDIVRHPGAFEKTVKGIGHLKSLGIHVHTNTTLCAANLHHASDIVRFVANDLGLRTMSMNMVIRTGLALDGTPIGLTYTQVSEVLPSIISEAQRQDVKLVWYSPIPYCIFNPVLNGMGAKSCACIDGILSVDPAGQVLPCSSFATGIGSLLQKDFAKIFHSRAAKYWREKRFAPPVCKNCPDLDVCGGACPLYWDAAGSFAELPVDGSDNPELYERWAKSRAKGVSFGVQPPSSCDLDIDGRITT